MARSTAPRGGDTPRTIGLQLAMAFGQGAGALLATPEALETAYDTYATAFEVRAREWSAFELRAIEYSRALGQVAAWTAISNGRCIIDAKDVKAAFAVVRRNRLRPLRLCDLTGGRNRPVVESPLDQ